MKALNSGRLWIGLALLAGAGCSVRAHVVREAVHPAYLHALSDLRLARAHLVRPTGSGLTNWDESVAIGEIDAAINELSQAALDDGKNPSAPEPVDVGLDWSGRLHRSLELLSRARHDADREEDNPNAVGWRNRGLHHIDEAIGHVRQGIAAMGPAPVVVRPPPPAYAPPIQQQHPAYIHALEDLRHARAHLERPAGVRMRTAWDEAIAIREIDEAIREIREAAIDDGKDVGAHPPVDLRLDWAGRLHRSAELLRKARNDCMREEDNAFARGLQHRAVQHIDAALGAVVQGIRANHY